MPATIDDLQKTLQDILKATQQQQKGAAGGTGGANAPGPKTLQDHFKNAFSKMGGKSGNNQGMANLASKMGGGGMPGGGGGAASSALGFMAPLVGIGVALAKLPQIINDFANSTLNANRQFAQFSPAMAQVIAFSDMRDQMRKMRQGEELAPSAGRLADARARVEDQFAGPETQLQRLKNNIAASLEEGLGTFLEKSEWGKQLTEGMKQFNDFLSGQEDAVQDEWIKELTKIADGQDKQHAARAQPVRNRDPRPSFQHDPIRRGEPFGGGGAGGDF